MKNLSSTLQTHSNNVSTSDGYATLLHCWFLRVAAISLHSLTLRRASFLRTVLSALRAILLTSAFLLILRASGALSLLSLHICWIHVVDLLVLSNILINSIGVVADVRRNMLDVLLLLLLLFLLLNDYES